MATPAVANYETHFYAAGNTPAASLTRCLPPGKDADILLLGCGDVRNILFTAYSDKGSPSRKLDITCCDVQEAIIARNAVLISFLVRGIEDKDINTLWDIYYHLYLDEPSLAIFRCQIKNLIKETDSLDAWRASPYGSILKFCDEATFKDFSAVLAKYNQALDSDDDPRFLEKFHESLKTSRSTIEEDVQVLTGCRSASPCALLALDELSKTHSRFWDTGSTDLSAPEPRFPNPMFASTLSKNVLLHYGTDPTFGFHLASGYTSLTEMSPLRIEGEEVKGAFKAVQAARVQFCAWVKAFRDMVVSRNVIIRFAMADALAFSHTLQEVGSSGANTAHWYRRQMRMQTLALDPAEYGARGRSPVSFDVIDTSNLADHLGSLNLLVAAGRLLKDAPSSALFTELLIRHESTNKEIFDKLLCGHALTISLLLDLAPVEYWTNATTASSCDELLFHNAGRSKDKSDGNTTQFRTRLTWKLQHHFSSMGSGSPIPTIQPQDLAKVAFNVYKEMFESENAMRLLASTDAQRIRTMLKSAYPHFQRGSLAAFLRAIKGRVSTDWGLTMRILIDMIVHDRTLYLGSNYIQDLVLHFHMFGLATDDWLTLELHSQATEGGFSTWDTIPVLVAVTLVVPRETFDRLYQNKRRKASPTLQISMHSSPSAKVQFRNLFADVQLGFGEVTSTGTPDRDDFEIVVNEDKHGWQGNASAIVSFYAPAASLLVEPKTATIALSVQMSMQSMALYAPTLGQSMNVYETVLSDQQHVFITKHMPGQQAYPVVCGATQDETHGATAPTTTSVSLNVDVASSKVVSISSRVDITSEKGRKLLEDRVPITMHQSGPFLIEAVFDKKKIVYPLRFPAPVDHANAKLRIARKSSYIEIVAPLADPVTSAPLDDFVFPIILSKSKQPTTMGLPSVNLDTLPIIDVSKPSQLSWLNRLGSFMFSSREEHLHKQTQAEAGNRRLSKSARLNFKDSLFTLFLVASGIEKDQTGLFALAHPEKGGIYLLIFVSALRLDGADGTVVADAAVLPLTMDMILGGELTEFLLMVRSLGSRMINVDDGELALWKKVLPALAERCRTWSHRGDCEYKRAGARIPLSLEHGEQLLCTCGSGKLPPAFIGVPEWDSAARLSTRIAISPTFAVPFVEELADDAALARAEKLVAAEKPQSKSNSRPNNSASDPDTSMGAPFLSACRNCGTGQATDGGPLKRCMRCREVAYCSGDCQKKHWKKHRPECKESM